MKSILGRQWGGLIRGFNSREAAVQKTRQWDCVSKTVWEQLSDVEEKQKEKNEPIDDLR